MEEKVILVDSDDHEIGIAEKLRTHREGALHRAFSIFVFNSKGELLLQKRAKGKYHSAGLWTNTCCGHPRPKEPIQQAVHRRLMEEMGFDCDLKEIFSFTYKVQLANDLVEHEYDYVFMGTYDGDPTPSPEEADDWKWTDLEELRTDVQMNPDRYAAWFRICIDKLIWHVRHSGAFHRGESTRGLATRETQARRQGTVDSTPWEQLGEALPGAVRLSPQCSDAE